MSEQGMVVVPLRVRVSRVFFFTLACLSCLFETELRVVERGLVVGPPQGSVAHLFDLLCSE